MTPGNTRSFKAIVNKGSITVACAAEDGSPSTMDLTIRSTGHVRIAETLFRYPQASEVLTAYVDAQSSGKAAAAAAGQGGPLVEAARNAAAAGGMSVGTLVALLVQELPTLVSELLVDSVELQDGESGKDLVNLIRSQDVDVFVGALMQWVKVNFSRGLAPLLAAAKLLGLKAKAAVAAPLPNAPASGNSSTDAGLPSAAPVAEPVGSTA